MILHRRSVETMMELSYAGVCFDLFGTLVDDEGRTIAGVREALDRLRDARWAIVTSASRSAATGLIARAQLALPPVLVSADDVVRSKPSPDPYAVAAQRLSLDPLRTLAVEDSASGVDAARAAGMEVIFIARGRPAGSSRAEFAVDRFNRLQFAVENGGIVVRF
jgi:mannitol-1-/sugar-/sorbitol-6-phosphatase